VHTERTIGGEKRDVRSTDDLRKRSVASQGAIPTFLLGGRINDSIAFR
jgi:hypothetical protein